MNRLDIQLTAEGRERSPPADCPHTWRLATEPGWFPEPRYA